MLTTVSILKMVVLFISISLQAFLLMALKSSDSYAHSERSVVQQGISEPIASSTLTEDTRQLFGAHLPLPMGAHFRYGTSLQTIENNLLVVHTNRNANFTIYKMGAYVHQESNVSPELHLGRISFCLSFKSTSYLSPHLSNMLYLLTILIQFLLHL